MSNIYTTPGILLCTKAPTEEYKVGAIVLTSDKNTPLLVPKVLPDDLKLNIQLTDKLLVGGSMNVIVGGQEYQLVKVDQVLLVIRD